MQLIYKFNCKFNMEKLFIKFKDEKIIIIIDHKQSWKCKSNLMNHTNYYIYNYIYTI